MDEPLSNLDAKLRAEMRTEIKRIQRQLDLTIIYVTHDQVEAMTMADRVMMLSEGVIEQLAEPEELYRAPATTTVGRFIGSPPMNILQFTAESELAALAPEELSISGGSFGVRPERVVLDQAGQEPQTGQMLLGEATVLVNELLGADRIMTSTLRTAGAKDGPGQRIVARIAPDQQVQVDDTVLVSTAADAVHWYHPETGRRVENTRTPGLTPA